jgi:hypothetical protein
LLEFDIEFDMVLAVVFHGELQWVSDGGSA